MKFLSGWNWTKVFMFMVAFILASWALRALDKKGIDPSAKIP